MLVCNRLSLEAKEIWNNYFPVCTELSGFIDLGGAAISLIAIYRMQNTDFDFVLTPQFCMYESAILFARGLTKLALPIIGSLAYLGYQKI